MNYKSFIKSKWKILLGLALSLTFGLCLRVITVTVSKPAPTPTLRPTPTPWLSPTPHPTPTVPVQLISPQQGKSYGIFYPFSEGVTINNSVPTIIGKLAQTTDLFLDTQFGLERSVINFEDEYFLRFKPGRVKNLTVMIDEAKVQPVFGIPHYPTVRCDTDNETECLTNKRDLLPSLVFFAKPLRPLTDGPHTLTLITPTAEKKMTFLINPTFHLASQVIFTVDRSEEFHATQLPKIFHTDNCDEGYYYDTNALKIPLPHFNNPSLYYGVAFPPANPKNNISTYRVQIAFENKRYDLFFPSHQTYYREEINASKNTHMSPFYQLFLPKDHLVYTSGKKALTPGPYTTLQPNGEYSRWYFEIFPIDVSGGIYPEATLPWFTSGSSSCDG